MCDRQPCTRCPELQTQVMLLAAGIQSVLAFIDKELDEPTMPAKRPRTGSHKGPDLITSIQARLGATLNSAY